MLCWFYHIKALTIIYIYLLALTIVASLRLTQAENLARDRFIALQIVYIHLIYIYGVDIHGL